MRFWDTSSIVPLLLEEQTTGHALELLNVDSDMIVWWATPVECWSAIMRREREGRLGSLQVDVASKRLSRMAVEWHEVAPVQEVRLQGRRLLRRHTLRAADAMQLAAALVWAGQSEEREFVTFDTRLKAVARMEGLVA